MPDSNSFTRPQPWVKVDQSSQRRRRDRALLYVQSPFLRILEKKF